MPKEHLQPDTNDLLNVLKDIIGFKTVAPPGCCYEEIVDYLMPIFRDMGFKTEKVTMPADVFIAKCQDPRLIGDRFNLKAEMNVGAKETLVIYAHLDVVPAEGKWETDPFQMTQRNGRIYGRGVSDCKGSIAALIVAFGDLSIFFSITARPQSNLVLANYYLIVLACWIIWEPNSAPTDPGLSSSMWPRTVKPSATINLTMKWAWRMLWHDFVRSAIGKS